MKRKGKKMNKYTQTYLKNNDKNPFDKNAEYINPFLSDQSNPFSCPKTRGKRVSYNKYLRKHYQNNETIFHTVNVFKCHSSIDGKG